MTQRRLLEQRLAGLGEIGEIMRSMKILAYMETRKLGRLIENQWAVVRQIDTVAADFLAFYPNVLPVGASSHRVFLLIGSRRGFCADFNEHLDSGLRRELAAPGDGSIIAVGRKLCLRLEEKGVGFIAGLDGADVAEEIPSVMRDIVTALDALQARHGHVALTVLSHRAGEDGPRSQRLLPPFEAYRGEPKGHAFAPILNLSPRDFLLGLGEQYLFAALHELLYESLLAENARRMRHLEGAVNHLEDRAEEIRRRVHGLRQEEIIEEIEVILLNSAVLDEPSATRPCARRD